MNKKMIAGLVAAIILFCFMGIISKAGSDYAAEALPDFDKLLSENGITQFNLPDQKFVAVIDINGTIQDVGSSDIFTTVEYDHQGILKFIDELIENPDNVGIFLNIDSPGGYTYQVVEVYEKLQKYKEQTGRKIYAYCNSYCCSGGYYIAATADEIYANSESIVGSIGVIMSSYNCTGLYEKLGIKEINITSGKNKAMGSAGTEMTEEQLAIYQSIIDESYERFVDVVSENRSIDRDTVYKLADGRIYSSAQAQKSGLIDGVMNYESFMGFLDKSFGNTEYYTFGQDAKNFYSLLFEKANQIIPKSSIQSNLDLLDKYEEGGIMYYADLN